MHRYFPRTAAIIAVSRDLADFTGIDRERITVIYNAVADKNLEVGAAEAPDHQWLSPGESPVVLGGGRLVPRKGFETLVRAFARVRGGRDCRLFIRRRSHLATRRFRGA